MNLEERLKWLIAVIALILVCGGILYLSIYPRLRDSGVVDYIEYRINPENSLPVATGAHPM